MEVAIITGASMGLGAEFARQLAARKENLLLVARSADKLSAAATELRRQGIQAKAFPADLAQPEAVPTLIARVKSELGPITVVHWNAYAGVAGDLALAPVAELRTALDVGVISLVATVQAALPDLKTEKDAAVLITGGGLSTYDARVDAMAVEWNAMGLAVTKAAQHKLTGLLGARLAKDSIYVGEVVVLSSVKGTPFDNGKATLEAATVANKFWEIYQARKERWVQLS